MPALLERSGCDLALALEFCERYGVGEAFPCLLYVDNQLGSPCVSPHDLSYQVCVHRCITLLLLSLSIEFEFSLKGALGVVFAYLEGISPVRFRSEEDTPKFTVDVTLKHVSLSYGSV